MRVLWEGDFFVHHSLARFNREVCRRLSADADLRVRHLGCAPERVDARLVEEWSDLARASGSGGTDSWDVVVRHHWPPNPRPPERGRWIVRQPWEVGGVPVSWKPMLERLDELWVPSEFTRRIFLENLGARAPRIEVVPDGVDTRVFRPDTGDGGAATGPLRLLYVGGTIWRKGIDIALDCYVKAFGGQRASRDTLLLVKDLGSRSFYAGNTLAARAIAAARDPANPPIAYTDRILTDGEMARLYAAADAVLLPYRGEGFCLPALEALACGTPVIATAGGPTDELCGSEEMLLRIPSHRTWIQWGEPTFAPCWVLEPDRDALVELLRSVARDRERIRARRSATARGLTVRQAGVERFTWDRAARKASSRVREVEGSDAEGGAGCEPAG